MNKRDFLIHGSGVLLGSSVLGPARGTSHDAVVPTTQPNDLEPVSEAAAHRLQDWQALQGAHFDVLTPLGRTAQLVLRQVSAMQPGVRHTELEQFTLAFEGPSGRPLQAGLHTLHHAGQRTVSVYLEPTQRGARITYTAHFSLLT